MSVIRLILSAPASLRRLLRTAVLKALILSNLLIVSMVAASDSTLPRVVVSINPVALIAKEIGAGAVDVHTLLPLTASAHDYPLKVSDYRLIDGADLLVWVGPELESFLAKIASTRSVSKVLELAATSDIRFPDDVDHLHNNHSHDGHDHGNRDPHIWLRPDNAALIARTLAERFIQLNPVAKTQILHQEQEFNRRLKIVDAEIKALLRPVGGRGFVVYHRGYDHFVDYYSLNQVGFVGVTPEQKLGAKHLAQLQVTLSKDAVCLISEPYQTHTRINQWAQKYGLKQDVIYPLGESDLTRFENLLKAVAGTFSRCLTP